MADLARVAHLRRQPLPETGLGAFESDAPLQFFINRFVDDAHTSLSYFAYDSKAVPQELSWLETMFGGGRGLERIQQEPVHTLFPLDVTPNLVEKLGVAGARSPDVG